MRTALSRFATTIVLGALMTAAVPTQAATPDLFTKKKVSFKNSTFQMSGELYLPAGYEKLGKLPAIVVAHPAGAVKEQAPASYARGLAAKGLVVLTYDASHQGESGGEPRCVEYPADRIEDIRCAVDYLTTLPFVDSSRIGAMGICAGGGYSIAAATTDRRIKAVAGVSATDAGTAMRDGWLGGTPVAEQLKLLEMASAQRTAEANGQPVAYGPYVPNAPDKNLPNTMQEAYVYYRTPRAQHPNSVNKVTLTTFNPLFNFAATDRIDTLLTQPMLLVVGSKSDARRFTDLFHEKAASKDKALVVIDGATHVDLYDQPKYVDPATARLAAFFAAKL